MFHGFSSTRFPARLAKSSRKLKKLRDMVSAAGGTHARILHTHFASLGAADAAFEQEAADLATLEGQIQKLTGSAEFQTLESADVGVADSVAQARNLHRGCCRGENVYVRKSQRSIAAYRQLRLRGNFLARNKSRRTWNCALRYRIIPPAP